MRICKFSVLQYCPVFGKVEENQKRVENEILQKIDEMKGCSVLLLPEMSFTGYVFNSKKEIEPYLEEENGSTFQWCSKQAKILGCIVVAGYPQIVRTHKDGKEEKIYYNSCCIVNKDGQLIGTYQKHFLYETDHNWASEGPCFSSFNLPIKVLEVNKTTPTIQEKEVVIKTAVGICMDLNPWEFKANFRSYEFGNHHSECKLILFLANWLKSDDNEPNSLPNYWYKRLTPLHGSDALFVASNRIGTEKGSTFAGSSCIIQLSETPLLLQSVGNTKEGVFVFTVRSPF